MSWKKSLAQIATSLILAGLAAVGLPAAPAVGNGAPINIALSYLDGVSNWGPTNAAGIAELVMKEGEVRLTATGLAPLQGEEYRLWLLNTLTGDQMALATFGTGEDRVTRLDLVLSDAIPEKGWNLLLVGVGPGSSPPLASSGRRSIAGRFPLPESSQGGRPAELPRTGDGEPAEFRVSSFEFRVLLLAALGLGLGLGVVATRVWSFEFRAGRGAKLETRNSKRETPNSRGERR